MKKTVHSALVTIGLLCCATIINLFVGGRLGGIAGSSVNTKLIYLLAVLLISRFTAGYFWGLISAIFSVPLDNYLFTYPYASFNLSISGYLLTFVTMLTVSLFVSLLTSRIQRQEQLRLEAEKEKLRANLLRAVSHDLRTPLTSIVGTTGAILDNALPQEKQRELLQDVNSDAQWLIRMIENLLAITRISGETASLNMDTELVEDVLAEAVNKFEKHFQNIKVRVDLSEHILLAQMDAVLIVQVISNLMENAVYHGKHTTEILLKARSLSGSMVEITVADNGAGIARDKLPWLFSGTLESEVGKSSDSHKHMGIGLSVCKSIIKAHGGTMTACNSETGGAVFRFTLPEKENEYGRQDFDH